MGWLSGWDQRIKLTIDCTKVDAALSHFPVTVFLSSTHGDCVFDELTADANRFKIAFTKSDGTTQLYGEIEKWDDASESAVIHVSRDGWAISNTVDTDFYLYYDVDHADNTAYIGDIDSTPGALVWNSDFMAVHHMADATTSTIKDSTSNSRDGTKGVAGQPFEWPSKVGPGQKYDGINDYIALPNMGSFKTVEQIVNADVLDADYDFSFGHNNFRLYLCPDDHPTNPEEFAMGDTLGADIFSGAVNALTYYYLVGVNNDSNKLLYLDGTLKDTGTREAVASNVVNLGRWVGNDHHFDGFIDETRISSTARPIAWIKATYNSLWDTLITYGDEEVLSETVCWGHDTGVVEDNIRDYSGNWTGTGAITGAGDAEQIELQTGEHMESEDWNLGSCLFNSARLRQNVYQVGDDVTLKYKTAATQGALAGVGWSAYTGPFQSLGWVKIRIER